MTMQAVIAMVTLIVAAGSLERFGPGGPGREPASRSNSVSVIASILVYHRFGATVTDAMTIRPATFRLQLQMLRDRGHAVVALRDVVDFLRGVGPAPPARAVVLTADDGHRSVFTEMLPIVSEARVPVTVFLYPSAISNASYAMTWDQLRTLQRSGWFDIQSHSYWHPNFRTEQRRLSPEAYAALVSDQLIRARTVLAATLAMSVDMIAWPFGIVDDDLRRRGAACGYVAGFSLERKGVSADDSIMALPRYLVTDTAGAGFAALLPK